MNENERLLLISDVIRLQNELKRLRKIRKNDRELEVNLKIVNGFLARSHHWEADEIYSIKQMCYGIWKRLQ